MTLDREAQKVDDRPGSTLNLVVGLVPPNARVLEVGNAASCLSEVLASRLGCSIVRIETSAVARQDGHMWHERVIVGDAEALDYGKALGTDLFDAIILANVIEHLSDPRAFLGRVRPFLSEGGSVIAMVASTPEPKQDVFDEAGYLVTHWLSKRVREDPSQISTPTDALPPIDRSLSNDVAPKPAYEYVIRAEAGTSMSVRDSHAELENLRAVLLERTQRLAEHEGQLQADRALLDLQRVTIARLSENSEREVSETRAQQRLANELAGRVAALDSELEALKSQYDEQAQAFEASEARLTLITSSTAWGITQRLSSLRLFVAPRNSRRERGLLFVRFAAREFERLGIVGIARKVITKIRRQTVRGNVVLQMVSAPGASQDAPRPTHQYDVIVLPIIDWDFRFQRPQQLAVQLAKAGHRVFYTMTALQRETEGILLRRIILPNVAEIALPGAYGLNIYRQSSDTASVDRWVAAFDRLRREMSIADAICVVDLPFWAPLATRLKERFGWKVVYDCMDRHADFSTNTPEMIKGEQSLTRDSDLVVVTSERLMEDQSAAGDRRITIPNAADYEHFSVGWASAPEVRDLRRPIIGYYGAISEWFDTSLVADIARRRPAWSFVLIGSTYGADVSALRQMRNVRLLGEQPYSALPSYLHSFDVCIIPFSLTPLIAATNPVKFYEYLSAGKPVVSVRLPELTAKETSGAERLVYFATTGEEFVAKIELALKEDGPSRIAARRRFAQENTWADRGTRFRDAVTRAYKSASLVVLTYNNLHLTKLCLDSVFRNTLWPNLEIVVVDNASTDGTREYLMALAATHPNMRLVLNETNEGFARGNNRGIRKATGEYIVLLNNDIVVSRGWLGRLIRHLERDPSVGLAGPVTNATGNEAQIDISYANLTEMEEFAERRALDCDGRSFEIKMLALFCTIMRRSLVDEVGLLDERFEVGMFEDDDLAIRVRQRGYKIICCDDVFIHHFQRASFKQIPDREYRRIFHANRARFEEKWGRRWEPHRRPRRTPSGNAGLS